MRDDTGLLALLDALRRRWLLVVLVAVPVVAGATWYAESLPSQYEAEAVVAFAPRPEAGIGADVVRLVLPGFSQYVQSPQVLAEVGEVVGVDAADLSRSLDVSVPAETGTLQITVERESPQVAAQVASALADAVVAFTRDDPLVDGRIVADAVPPEEASGPPRTLLEVAAGLLGLLAGAALAIVIERLRPRVRSAEDMEQFSGLPVIGQLPVTRFVERRPGEALGDPIVGAQIRSLRTTYTRAASAERIATVMVTSATAAEGKTTVATLFAASIGLVQTNVLLVDGDLLRPTVSRRLALNGSPGLAEVLRGEVSVDDAIRPEVLDNVSVLPTTSDSNAGDLLVRAFGGVLADLRTRHELVVIDAPPLFGSDAARALATQVDAVILVVAAGNPVAMLRETVSTLRGLDVRILGIVANRIQRRETSAAYTYTAH